MDEKDAKKISASITNPLNEFALWIARCALKSTSNEQRILWVSVAARVSGLVAEIKDELAALQKGIEPEPVADHPVCDACYSQKKPITFLNEQVMWLCPYCDSGVG